MKKKFNITLASGLYKKLKRWAESEGDETATKAAYLLTKAIEEAEEKGKIPLENEPKPKAENFELLKEYTLMLLGGKTDEGFDFKALAEIAELDVEELETLYKEVSESR